MSELEQIKIQEAVSEVIENVQETVDDEELASGSYQKANNLITLVRKLQDEDLDIVMPITARKGFGKSTLELFLINQYLKKYFPDFSLHANLKELVLFDHDETTENLLSTSRDYMPLGLDEMSRFMMGEDHAKKDSKDFKKLLNEVRTKHRFIVGCLPDLWWLDSKYREDMVTMWIHVVARGTAIVFLPDLRIGIDDCWHRKAFQKMPTAINIFTNPEKVVDMYRKHPCFFEVIRYPPTEKRLYDKYLELRAEAVARRAQGKENTSKKVNAREIIRTYIMFKEGKTIAEIARTLNRPRSTIQVWVEQMRDL